MFYHSTRQVSFREISLEKSGIIPRFIKAQLVVIKRMNRIKFVFSMRNIAIDYSKSVIEICNISQKKTHEKLTLEPFHRNCDSA